MVVPLIKCPECHTRVKFYLSNTERHEGWVFYKCVNHRVSGVLCIKLRFLPTLCWIFFCRFDILFTVLSFSAQVTCDFWHWEREYVAFLVENCYLEGNEAVDAIGSAEDRREELNGRARRRGYADAAGLHGRNEEWVAAGRDQAWVAGTMSKQQAEALVGLGKEMVMVLKALMGTVIVMCVLLVVVILKK